MFKESQQRIKEMALVHNKLYQTKDFTNIDFNRYIKELGKSIFRSLAIDINRIKLKIEAHDVSLDLDKAIPCGLIINELVTNSLKYAFPENRDGEVKIVLQPLGDEKMELRVSDNGAGMPDDFNFWDTDTIGLKIVTVLAEKQLHGKIDFETIKGVDSQICFNV